MSGVGGQGTIVASDILCDVALAEGYDVKKSDSLGMSQRGGSVVSHVRMGEKVFSPLIGKGSADILIAFEKLEAARYTAFLKKNGIAIVNDYTIPPLIVSAGQQAYPEDDSIHAILSERTEKVYSVPAHAIAMELKNVRVANLVMLGFLSNFLPLSQGAWKDAVTKHVPQRYVELNFQAFALGVSQANQKGGRHGSS
jgi:indolepyruvate ferredoxin oxidoreductase beta subunit